MYYSRLKDLREDNDLVQKQIADVLGIDQRVYSNYETGKREIPTHLVVKLAKYYKTSTDYILGLTDKPWLIDKRDVVNAIPYKFNRPNGTYRHFSLFNIHHSLN